MVTLSWEVYVSKETKDWLGHCHAQDDIVAEVASTFILRLQKIRLLGPFYGKDTNSPIKHLVDLDDLWEARVHHPTGWYRLFFRFVKIEGQQAATVGGEGIVKKERDLPRRTLDVASHRVNDYIDALRADPQLRASDRMK